MTQYKKGAWTIYRQDGTQIECFNHSAAPKKVLDVQGFDNERYIPDPGVYIRCPCDCGKVHSWNIEGPQSFFIDHIIIGLRPNMMPIMIPAKKCKECKETLMMELEEENPK